MKAETKTMRFLLVCLILCNDIRIWLFLVIVPANIQKEKKSALSILEQMFPEEKDFIHKKDAKMEKIRAVAMKETVPVGPGVKEALAKIEAKKAAEKAAALAKQGKIFMHWTLIQI